MPSTSDMRAVAELAAVLSAEICGQELRVAPHLIADDVMALRRIAISTKRWAEASCNGYTPSGRRWDDAAEKAKDRADARALAAAQAIADRYGAKAEVGGDPRGFTLRLHLASGRRNGWGDGWGIGA